jgi:hypothetical protein
MPVPSVVTRLYGDAELKRKKIAQRELDIQRSMMKSANMFSGKVVDLEYTARLHDEFRERLTRRAEEEVHMAAMLRSKNPKSDPTRARKLYEDASLKRERLARLQVAHQYRTAIQLHAKHGEVKMLGRDEILRQVNPPNRSAEEREEKDRKAAEKRARESAKRRADAKQRRAEAAEREQRRLADEQTALQQKRLAEQYRKEEAERKAGLAAALEARRQRDRDTLLEMRNTIKAFTDSTLRTIPVDTSTSDAAARVAKKAADMQKMVDKNRDQQKLQAATDISDNEYDDDENDFEDSTQASTNSPKSKGLQSRDKSEVRIGTHGGMPRIPFPPKPKTFEQKNVGKPPPPNRGPPTRVSDATAKVETTETQHKRGGNFQSDSDSDSDSGYGSDFE